LVCFTEKNLATLRCLLGVIIIDCCTKR
jgi:hypothetical protein